MRTHINIANIGEIAQFLSFSTIFILKNQFLFSSRICETHSASESIYFHEYQKMQEVLSSAKLETVDQPVKKLETEQTENIHNMDDNSLVKQKSEKSKKEEEVKDATENNLDAQSFPEFVLNG